MGSIKPWKVTITAGLFAASVILTGCGDDDIEPDVEIETETEIPGVDAPEVEVD